MCDNNTLRIKHKYVGYDKTVLKHSIRLQSFEFHSIMQTSIQSKKTIPKLCNYINFAHENNN